MLTVHKYETLKFIDHPNNTSMHKTYLLLFVCLIMFVSCQRETGAELLDNTSDDSGLLVKRVDESTEPGVPGKAVATSEYEYNSEKKLIRTIINSAHGSITRHSDSRYTRDSKGRIMTIAATSQRLINGAPYQTLEWPAFDTVSTMVIYQDELSQKIKYIKRIIRSGEKTTIDSSLYDYDSNGHVKKIIIFYLPFGVHLPGEQLMSSGYSAWTFNAKGSLMQLEEYGEANGNFFLQIRYRFEYDNKINPLFTNEYVFLYNWFDLSPNNVVKQKVYIPAYGEDYDNTATYQYRPDDKPLSVIYFSPPTVTNTNRQSNFYYK